MKQAFIAAALTGLLYLSSATAFAAGAYDGTWTGQVAGMTGGHHQGRCNGTVTLTVKNNRIAGEVKIGMEAPIAIREAVAPNGTVRPQGGPLRGKFEAAAFEGALVGSHVELNCSRFRVSLTRS